MGLTLEIGIVVLLAAALALQWLQLRKRVTVDLTPLEARMESIERAQERTERGLREELGRSRDDAARGAQALRQEVQSTLAAFNSGIRDEMGAMSAAQSAELVRLGEATSLKLETVRGTVQERLQTLQDENAKKLDQIRHTVDEQLQGTLEKRLGESFRLVSERLEQVHRGLGEMQNLAAGVGDLKKLLSNVRTRGSWGEVQLGMLLEELLTPDQYAANVADYRDRRAR